MRGQCLCLAFGGVDAEKEETQGTRIGKNIVKESKAKEFCVKSNGTFKERLFIDRLDWKRRIPP